MVGVFPIWMGGCGGRGKEEMSRWRIGDPLSFSNLIFDDRGRKRGLILRPFAHTHTHTHKGRWPVRESSTTNDGRLMME